jgi:hypothetical protein
MATKDVSRHLFNPSLDLPSNKLTMEFLNNGSSRSAALLDLTTEFCTTFNLKIDGVGGGEVFLATPNGLPCGSLDITTDRNSAFLYRYKNSGTIKSKRGGPVRSSKHLTSLIKSVEKNDEIGTDKQVIEFFGSQIRAGFENIQSRTIRLNMSNYASQELLADAVLVLSGEKEATHEMKVTALRAAEQFNAELERSRGGLKTKERFATGGMHIVGLANDGYRFERSEQRFFIGEAVRAPESTAPVLNSLIGSNSLGDNFIIRTAMAYAKSKYESNSKGYTRNEFKIPFTDTYDEELDVVIAYTNHDMVWVFIPKVAP